MNRPAESSLIAQLREVDSALRGASIRYALIGGVAVNIHGFIRATRDLDILLLGEDSDIAHRLFTELGYTAIDRRDDLASYVRQTDRLDVIYARRPISRNLLDRSLQVSFADTSVPAIPVEGLLGLKIQALNDDPRRIKDLNDLIELFRIHRGRLNLAEVRSYFRLFDREKLLDDILRALD